jgi:hypothetical protein
MNLHLLKNLNASGAMTAVSRRVQNYSMKTTLALIIAAASLCGCTTTKIKTPTWEAQNTSVLWKRSNLVATVSTNGTATISEAESSPDSESIKILAAALAAKP